MRRPFVVSPVVAALALGLAVPPTGHAGARPRDGRDGNRKASRSKVVRIERVRAAGGTLRACQVTFEPNYPASNIGMCWGAAIAEGEEATVVDVLGTHGRIRVTAVTEPNCSGGYYNAWTFQYEVIDGNLDPSSSGYATMHGIFDLELSPLARSVEPGQIQVPSSTGAESPLVAVDTDGQDGEDLIVSYYSCDEAGAVVPGVYGSTQPYALCLDYWLRDRGAWRRGRHDLVPNCTP